MIWLMATLVIVTLIIIGILVGVERLLMIIKLAEEIREESK